MKKLLITMLMLSLAAPFLFAQQHSQAELDRVMKQAQEQMKKYGKDSVLNKMMKSLQDQQNQVSGAMKSQPVNGGATINGSGVSGGSLGDDPGEYRNVDNWSFPTKNAALMLSIPKKLFSRAELVSFLNDLYAQLSKKMPAGIASSVQSIAARYKNDAQKMGDEAVTGWYTNYRQESLLLIIKAAANDPDNGLLLNNCAAILNMGGIEQKAIPILKFVLQSYPGNSMVLNNLGEAYAGLGETDTAMYYLGRCIKTEPENPEANNTAGQIEATRGNTESAISYFEQSIKGAYNKPAELKLRKIKKGSDIVPLVRPRIKLPDYFNPFKYKLPAQCTSVEKAAVAEAEYKAFHQQIGSQLEDYDGKLSRVAIKVAQNPMPSNLPTKDGMLGQPFYEFCGIMYRDVLKDFTDNLGSYDKTFYSDYTAIDEEYKGKFRLLSEDFDKRTLKCCGEGKPDCCPTKEEKCNAFNNLANQYLSQFATITEDWQEKNELYFKNFFDELVYWGYLHLHPLSDDHFRAQCWYPVITHYLAMLAKVGITRIIKPCDFEPTTATADSITIKEIECPLSLEIPFLVGKFELSCDKFSFKAGEGAVFGYEKDFRTHQSTVSVGIGLKLESKVKAGPLKGGVSVSTGEVIYLTFDGDNKFADGGLKFNAKASAGIEGEAGEAVKGKADVAKAEAGVGYTVGINSGWNFNEGPFKGMADPGTETQQNKNVNVYKSHN